MTSSNQRVQRIETNKKLEGRLEKLGAREIFLWKAMVLQDESLFAEVYDLIYCDNPRLAWHAAWVIDHVSEDAPEKLEPFVPELIEHLPKLKSSSLRRHFTRMLIRQVIPENLLGKLVDVLYDLLSPSEAIAVRANALQLLYQIALKEPGLKSELITVTESILEEELTPGMMSKGKRILKSLRIQ